MGFFPEFLTQRPQREDAKAAKKSIVTGQKFDFLSYCSDFLATEGTEVTERCTEKKASPKSASF
jgi:hypothetical protein